MQVTIHCTAADMVMCAAAFQEGLPVRTAVPDVLAVQAATPHQSVGKWQQGSEGNVQQQQQQLAN
jgi:hypothetical protein